MLNILVSALNTILSSKPNKALLTQFSWVSLTSEENIINSETTLKLIWWTSLSKHPGAVPFSSNKISSSLLKFLVALAILESFYDETAVGNKCNTVKGHGIIYPNNVEYVNFPDIFQNTYIRQLYHERSNAIKGDLHVIYNVTKDNLAQALSAL